MQDAGVGAVNVLHVPHHGSRFGLDSTILSRLRPKLAVISVGENSYGHLTKEVLRLLEEQHVEVFRTDQEGHITIVTDGNRVSLK